MNKIKEGDTWVYSKIENGVEVIYATREEDDKLAEMILEDKKKTLN